MYYYSAMNVSNLAVVFLSCIPAVRPRALTAVLRGAGGGAAAAAAAAALRAGIHSVADADAAPRRAVCARHRALRRQYRAGIDACPRCCARQHVALPLFVIESGRDSALCNVTAAAFPIGRRLRAAPRRAARDFVSCRNFKHPAFIGGCAVAVTRARCATCPSLLIRLWVCRSFYFHFIACGLAHISTPAVYRPAEAKVGGPFRLDSCLICLDIHGPACCNSQFYREQPTACNRSASVA
eukprot:IDg13008t1